jgi:hypothetical protein
MEVYNHYEQRERNEYSTTKNSRRMRYVDCKNKLVLHKQLHFLNITSGCEDKYLASVCAGHYRRCIQYGHVI